MGAPVPLGFCTLHLHGGDVQIDLCDLVCIDPYNIKWTIVFKGNTKYATAKILVGDSIKNVYMHRFILGLSGKDRCHVDHIDRNGLHNRRVNLRTGTAHQNWVNSGPRARGKSRYKGVSKAAKRWRATIQAHRQWKQIGVFDTEEEAARAYDLAAVQLFGETAYLNKQDFPL